MQINYATSLSQFDGDWCGTGRPKLPIPPKNGPLYASGFAKVGDDYCGNGKIPIPPKPNGGPWGQTAF
jgi:hypothetical protein